MNHPGALWISWKCVHVCCPSPPMVQALDSGQGQANYGGWVSGSLPLSLQGEWEGKWEMHWFLLQVWKRPSSQRQGPWSLAPFSTPCQECPFFVRNKGVEDFGREEFCFRSRKSCHFHENCNLGENSQVRDLEASNTAGSKQFSIWTDGLVQLGVPLGHFLGPPYPYKKANKTL